MHCVLVLLAGSIKTKQRRFQAEFISSNGKYQKDVLAHTAVIYSKRITQQQHDPQELKRRRGKVTTT